MFMIAAYGTSGIIMSKCRKWLWAQKTARSHAAPKLASLPLTTEGSLQNAKRALKSDPASLSPLDYGWEAVADNVNKTLSNYCSRRSVHGTRLHSEAHSLWL